MQKSVTFPDKSAVIPHFYISPGTGIKRSSSRRGGGTERREAGGGKNGEAQKEEMEGSYSGLGYLASYLLIRICTKLAARGGIVKR